MNANAYPTVRYATALAGLAPLALGPKPTNRAARRAQAAILRRSSSRVAYPPSAKRWTDRAVRRAIAILDRAAAPRAFRADRAAA